MNGVPVDARDHVVATGEQWEVFLKRMEKDGICAEAPVVMASSVLLEIRICIYWARVGAKPVKFNAINSEEAEARTIHLGFLPTCAHYESISCKSCCLKM